MTGAPTIEQGPTNDYPTAPVTVAVSRVRPWTRMLFALAAFLLLPMQLPTLVPIERTIVLFVPAMAACALVGWWAGGRASLALLWMAAAVAVMSWPRASGGAFDNLSRGWSLLLAGGFGLVCLLTNRRPFFPRGLATVLLTFGLAAGMSLVGSVPMSTASSAIADEYGRRNAETMAAFNEAVSKHPDQWKEVAAALPDTGTVQVKVQAMLDTLSAAGVSTFPALLGLESLAALALAWATYHRLARIRLGIPLAPLREFRFNDQLVWGLIVGLVILVLPTLAIWRGAGRNLVVFFAVLYAVRGLAVLAWFTAPGALTLAIVVGLVMLCLPFLNAIAALGFIALSLAAMLLGLGDTWADWRARAVAVRPAR